MISGDGMESMKIGHIDCFDWMKSSTGAKKKRNIASCNCREYKTRGCPATKRKWICRGKCEFQKSFCCEYFKGDDILVCIYAFKHNHSPNQVEIREDINVVMEQEVMDVNLISDDYFIGR